MASKRSVNVLFGGHAGAGKSTTIKKIRKFMQDKSQYLYSTVDKNHDECVEGAQFGELTYETKTSRYHFLEAPSHRRYESKMTSKAKQADIAVMFVSGCEGDTGDELKSEKSNEFICWIMALGIPKVLLVFSKIDDKSVLSGSFDQITTEVSNFLTETFNFKFKKDFDCIPLSFQSGLNIQTCTGMEEKFKWWKKGHCFFDGLDALKVPAIRSKSPTPSEQSPTVSSVSELIEIDLFLDKHPEDAQYWCKRAYFLVKRTTCSAFFQAMDNALKYGFTFQTHFDLLQDIQESSGVLKIIEGGVL